MNNQTMKTDFLWVCLVSSVHPTNTTPGFPVLFHLRIPPHLWLFHPSPAHLLSTPHHLCLPSCFHLSSHRVTLYLLPLQKYSTDLAAFRLMRVHSPLHSDFPSVCGNLTPFTTEQHWSTHSRTIGEEPTESLMKFISF